MFLEKQIIMLPTVGRSNLWLDSFGTDLYNYPTDIPGVFYQHLYVLSEEIIKEGDYCYDRVLNIVFQTDKYSNLEYVNSKTSIVKVIATTDRSVNMCTSCGDVGCPLCTGRNIPLIHESFVDKYVSSFNKVEIISKVRVEYESDRPKDSMHFAMGSFDRQIKVNSDNTVNIKLLKTSYNKFDKDLRKAFEDFACAVYNECYGKDVSFKESAEKMSRQWIKGNL